MVPEELRHTVAPFSTSVDIDVSGLSHPGKVRERNEDHFIVTRIGRYLETVLTSPAIRGGTGTG